MVGETNPREHKENMQTGIWTQALLAMKPQC